MRTNNTLLVLLTLLTTMSCREEQSADEAQRYQQERILQEGNSAVGMPAIKNFRERRILKDILELRDQEGLVTYTYLFTETGRMVFLCESIGYGIPAATQFTNPQKTEQGYQSITTIAQADPNGLFSPTAAEGTWVLCRNPKGSEVKPVLIEPRAVFSPFPLPTGEPMGAPPASPQK